jgi:hypothetical protein
MHTACTNTETPCCTTQKWALEGNSPVSTKHSNSGGHLGFPGDVPQRNGRSLSEILRGSPAGQIFSRLRALLPVHHNHKNIRQWNISWHMSAYAKLLLTFFHYTFQYGHTFICMCVKFTYFITSAYYFSNIVLKIKVQWTELNWIEMEWDWIKSTPAKCECSGICCS